MVQECSRMWVKLEASQARMGADLDRLLLHSGGLENLSNYFYFFTHTHISSNC